MNSKKLLIFLLLFLVGVASNISLCMEEQNTQHTQPASQTSIECLKKLSLTLNKFLKSKGKDIRTGIDYPVSTDIITVHLLKNISIDETNDVSTLKALNKDYIEFIAKNNLMHEAVALVKYKFTKKQINKLGVHYHADQNSNQLYSEAVFYKELNDKPLEIPNTSTSGISSMRNLTYGQVAIDSMKAPLSDPIEIQKGIFDKFVFLWSFVFLKTEKLLLKSLPGAKYCNLERKLFLNPYQKETRELKNEQRLDSVYSVLLVAQSIQQQKQARRIVDIVKP